MAWYIACYIQLTVRAGLIPLLHLVSREANDAAVGHPIAASPLDVVQNGTVPSEDLVAVHWATCTDLLFSAQEDHELILMISACLQISS